MALPGTIRSIWSGPDAGPKARRTQEPLDRCPTGAASVGDEQPPAAPKRPGSLPFGGPNRERDQERLIVLLGSLLAAALVLIATTIYIASLRQDATQRANEEQIVRANLTVLERPSPAIWPTTPIGTMRWSIWPGLRSCLGKANIGPTVHDTLGYAVTLLLDPRTGRSMARSTVRKAPEQAAATLGRRDAPGDQARAVRPGKPIRGRRHWRTGVSWWLLPRHPAGGRVVPGDAPGESFVLMFAKRLDATLSDNFETDLGWRILCWLGPDQPDTELASVDLIGPAGNVDRPSGLDPVGNRVDPADVVLPALLGPRSPSSSSRAWLCTEFAWRGRSGPASCACAISRKLPTTGGGRQTVTGVSSGSPKFCPEHRCRPGQLIGRTRQDLTDAGVADPASAVHAADLAATTAVPEFHLDAARTAAGAQWITDERSAGGRSGGRVVGYRGVGREITDEWKRASACGASQAAVPLPGREHARHHFLPRRGRRWPARL